MKTKETSFSLKNGQNLEYITFVKETQYKKYKWKEEKSEKQRLNPQFNTYA